VEVSKIINGTKSEIITIIREGTAIPVQVYVSLDGSKRFCVT
jgi:hypothetical protein